MSRMTVWAFMLTKRLYKKISFLVILALIVLAAVALGSAAEGDSGFLHIVLANTDTQDPVSSEIVSELTGEESIIRFSEAESVEQALTAVEQGDADAAWIFPHNMSQKLKEYAGVDSDRDPFISVVVREESVFLRLSNEKLSGALYKHCAKAYYLDYARTDNEVLDSLTDEELMHYFDEVSITEELFVYADGALSSDGQSSAENNYVTAPLRGLLGILAVICGMAAGIYYIDDELRGTYSWVRETKRVYVLLASVYIAVFNVCAISLVALLVAGISAPMYIELPVLVLYSACVSVFCVFFVLLFHSTKRLGAVIMPLAVLMTAVCPIFFDFRGMYILQMLLPPTYYVNTAYDARYLLYMAVYSTVFMVLSLIIDRAKTHFRLDAKM